MIQGNFNILDYIVQQTGSNPKKKGNKVLLNPCPICGHRDHFFVWPENNSYYSFSGCCRGGSLIDWLMEYEKIPLSEAMRKVNEDSPPPPAVRRKNREMDKLAKLLDEKLEAFFCAMVAKYQLMKRTEEAFERLGIAWENPYYRWIRQSVRFFDTVTERFIMGDYPERVRLMREHQDAYFFQLCPRSEVSANE